MRVVVTGGTGFIGRAVVSRLLGRGDMVVGLTRQAKREESGTSPGRARRRVEWVQWDPLLPGDWQDALPGADAVIHLAGEMAVGRRLTDALKKQILDSRVASTRRIVEGIEQAHADQRPRVLVCASGVGYYGNRSDDLPLDESAPAGDDFFAKVCVQWERAAREAEKLGVRVVSGRIGFVLGRGGALERMAPIFKAFVGGPLGSGSQTLSWIHVEDVAGAFVHAVDSEALRGPMNVSGPNAVTNAELSRVLGRVLRRPSWIPAPAFALRALFGEGAEPLLGGQRAVPRALLDHGYRFQFTDLETALRDVLG